MQELNIQEIEEISGAGIMYAIGYGIAYLAASYQVGDQWNYV